MCTHAALCVWKPWGKLNFTFRHGTLKQILLVLQKKKIPTLLQSVLANDFFENREAIKNPRLWCFHGLNLFMESSSIFFPHNI